ncbi:MAG: site-specific integrase [Clostridia bacterium]|nr:site-specific integrase [Clostridia bacterium]MBR0537880.1 site-specific integrase [Clostridia bacterium]
MAIIMVYDSAVREGFRKWLVEEEKSPHTVSAYLRHVASFAAQAGEGELTREAVQNFRDALLARGRQPASVNAALCAVLSSCNNSLRLWL